MFVKRDIGLFVKETLMFSTSLTLLLCMLFLDVNGRQANFEYQKIPTEYQIEHKVIATSIVQGAYDLTNSLPEDYDEKGSTDYTKYIQNGINTHDKVVFPDFPILINSNGLVLKSNSSLIFRPHSQLIMKENGSSTYAILKLNQILNVSIYYPNLVGDRDKHFGSEGQWGMGISIKSSKNIVIYHPNISKCWGDGIYIGRRTSSSHSNPSQNIKIIGGVLDYNRRNGISIATADSVMIKKTLIANTYGNSPMSGIDIEPNSNDDVIRSIYLDSVTTFNNGRRGILIYLKNFIGKKEKYISITINNHKDINSMVPLDLGVSKLRKGEVINGSIKIEDPNWAVKDLSKPLFHYYKGRKNPLNIVIKNLHVFEGEAFDSSTLFNRDTEALKREYKDIEFLKK